MGQIKVGVWAADFVEVSSQQQHVASKTHWRNYSLKSCQLCLKTVVIPHLSVVLIEKVGTNGGTVGI